MIRLFEKIFVVAMLFYTTEAAMPYFVARVHGYSGLRPSMIELLVQTAFYAVALCFIALRWRRVAEGALRVPWILALMALTLASTGWSQDPSITLRRSLVICATTIFAIYFSTEFTVPEQLRLLACTFGLVIVASFAFALLLPRYGIDQTLHLGDWQGAYYQKNMLARAMVLATLIFAFVRFKSGGIFRWLGFAGAITLLIFTHSVSGAIVCAAILATLPTYRIFRTRFSFGLPIFLLLMAGGAVAGAIVYNSLPGVLQLLHRDEGLTGRFELWSAVLQSISKRPWLGYGFSAFWQGLHGESANVLMTVQWSPGYAHNGFLDLVLDMGLVGLALFVAAYLSCWRKAIRFVMQTRDSAGLWFCAYLTFMLLYNLTEGPALSQNNISWVLFVATSVSVTLYLPAKAAVHEPLPPAAAVTVAESELESVPS